MAKKRNEPTPSNPNLTLLVMVVGGLLVAGLVGWALTRQVESAPPVVVATSNTSAPSTDTSTTRPVSEHDFTETERQAVARIAVEDLHAKINRNEVTVIDVRDAGGYTAGHIPGALHIPLARIQGEIGYLPKGKPIVTYCT